ncbi:hypothetical protein C0J52_26318 [Blattella germanica]|nr:hypothetical protein C0J52_26318 [Blattella germanica]
MHNKEKVTTAKRTFTVVLPIENYCLLGWCHFASLMCKLSCWYVEQVQTELI